MLPSFKSAEEFSSQGFFFALACIPLGIAAQNIGLGLIFVVLMTKIYLHRRTMTWKALELYKYPILLSLLILAIMSFSSYMNPNNAISWPMKQLLGHSVWLLAPGLFLLTCAKELQQGKQKLFSYLLGLSVVFALIAITQYIWGWRILGHSFVASDGFRPRGLYSHPLTFAYVLVLFWPLAVINLFRRYWSWKSWIFFASIGACLVLTRSRTVQVLAFFVLVLNALIMLQGGKRLLAVLALTCALLGTMASDNMVSRKLLATFSQQGLDRHSQYPDDRLAFWHAHWEMIKERPLLGHGFMLDTSYRKPYYEKIGLASFEKQYEAHNTFIQIAANSGLVGLFLFFWWISWHVKFVLSWESKSWEASVLLQTLVCFFVACLSQNGFQDASVRIVLSLLISYIWICGYQDRRNQRRLQKLCATGQ